MPLKLNGTNSVAAPAYAGDDADTGLQCGTNELNLVTGGTARVKIASDGAVQLLSSTGIDFSGIQTNASGMTSETLDSYEEGTWTPTLISNDGSLSVTYGTVTSGFYTKIGRLVQVSGRVEIATSNSSGDTLFIEGLPFTSATSSVSRPGFGSIAEVRGFAANKNPQAVLVGSGGTSLQLRRVPDTGNSTNILGTETTNSTRVLFIAQYFVG